MSEPRTEPESPPNRKRLIWILAILLAIIVVGVVAFVIASRGPAPVPSPTSTETRASTPTTTVTVTPAPSPTETPTPTPPPGPDPRLENFTDALSSGNTAALEQELANPITVIIAASECCGATDPVQAISDLAYVNPGSGATWNFALDEATLADWRSGFYVEYFPSQALVGLSSDGYVVSFIPATPGGPIETLFMAGEPVL